MQHDKLDLTPANQNLVGLMVGGQERWVPAIAFPIFTTKGLPLWKRFREKNWRPQCSCGQIFESIDDYNAHVLYWNSVYGKAVLEARSK